VRRAGSHTRTRALLPAICHIRLKNFHPFLQPFGLEVTNWIPAFAGMTGNLQANGEIRRHLIQPPTLDMKIELRALALKGRHVVDNFGDIGMCRVWRGDWRASSPEVSLD
jgi:hypothetical protein